MTFVGLDLHKRYITACALDATGAVLAEVRQMAVSLEALASFLSGVPAPISVGMEACLYWQWLHDQLEAQGHTVRVADARQVKVIWQARSKTDPIDARKLAELLRANLLPTIWIPDADTRRRRQLLHGRAFLVRQRTQVKNRIHGRLTAENLLFPRSDLYGRAGRAWLATAPMSAMLRTHADRLLRIHDALTTEIEQLDDEVKRLRRDHPMIERLHTIPGVGLFGALFLVAEIGAIERFTSSHRLSAYAGSFPHPELGWQDEPRRHGPREQPVAQVDPRRDRADPETRAGPGGRPVSSTPPGQGEAQGNHSGRAETLLLYLLDVAGRVELRGVARGPPRGTKSVGGAPGSTAGSGGVGSHSPVNANGPPPSNPYSCPHWTKRRLKTTSR